MTRNPFRVNEDILPDYLQENILKQKCNSTAKDDFDTMPLTEYWAKYVHIYKSVGVVPIRTLVLFSSTYLWKNDFFRLCSRSEMCY